ncbi:LysR family transcriptional regulator [Caldimonas brevitalea]|uniref:LysR family transcriptional regulator n=1 Tax=Caldimonas brevitalea TaxID=413882 RepID=UPI00069AB62B|nr:LysR family transcriptional regulator [Caldimonas brevitalea]
MPLQLRQLQVFVSIAQTRNLTRAAGLVHLSPSSVSEQLSALEAHLGAKLFMRTRDGLRITGAGEVLLDYAKELLDLSRQAEAAVAAHAEAMRGQLRVGALESLCAAVLPRIAEVFAGRCPQVQLVLDTDATVALRLGVKGGTLDAAFLFSHADDAELETERVGQDEAVVILPQHHRLAQRSALSPQDLAGERVVATARGCVYRGLLDAVSAASGSPLQVGMESGSIAAARALVAAGAGVSIVPRLAVSFPGASQGLALVPLDDHRFATVPIFMVSRRQRRPAPALRVFLQTAREVVSGQTVPTVHVHNGARDVAVVEQVQDGLRDVGRLPGPAHR